MLAFSVTLIIITVVVFVVSLVCAMMFSSDITVEEFENEIRRSNEDMRRNYKK